MRSNSSPSAHGEDVTELATAWFVRMTSDLVTAEDRCAFREWVERDPAHRDAYARAEALWRELGAIPDPRRPPGLAGTIPAVAGGSGVPALPLRRHNARRFGALAASLLVAALLGLWGFGNYDRLLADYSTAVGETRTVTLADGSVAHLNTDTALTVDFSADRRHIRLHRGEAYFAVAPDGSRPFDVVAAGALARAVGTAFDLRREGEAVSVVVAEGHVRVWRERDPPTAAGGVMLGPGDSLQYTAGGPGVQRKVDVSSLTAWRQGKLVFVDRPLRAVVSELDRYRPGAIVFFDSAIAEERFSGVISLTDTDQALVAIESTLPVEVFRITGYLTVLRASN